MRQQDSAAASTNKGRIFISCFQSCNASLECLFEISDLAWCRRLNEPLCFCYDPDAMVDQGAHILAIKLQRSIALHPSTQSTTGRKQQAMSCSTTRLLLEERAQRVGGGRRDCRLTSLLELVLHVVQYLCSCRERGCTIISVRIRAAKGKAQKHSLEHVKFHTLCTFA